MPRRLAACLLAALAAACGADAPAAPRQVLLIVLDATQAAQLSCQGGPAGTTPVLDALAARGSRFTQAFSQATWTLPSTVSLLTGRLPEQHGVVTARHVAPPTLELLTERLDAAGYETAFFSQMVFASARHGLSAGADEYELCGHGEPGRAALLDRAREWLARPRERGFLYVHLRRPHTPYDAGADADSPVDAARDRELSFAPNDEAAALSAEDAARVRALYRANLHAADADVGALLAAAPLDTLVIVTSDHGEGLGEHGQWGHGRGLWPEHVHVPLLVAGPGVVPRVVDEPVGTIDLAPTLCELLGVAPLPEMDGRSWAPWLRGGTGPPRSVPLGVASRRYPGEVPTVALVDDGLFLRRDAAGALTLLDARRDTGPLAPDGERAAFVERRLPLLQGLRDWTAPPPGTEPETSPEIEAQLRALGYVR